MPPHRHLRLARACGHTVRLHASGRCPAVGVQLLVLMDDMRIWERGLGHAPQALADVRSLSSLAVRGEVERDEEDEVRAENADAGEGGEFFSGAVTQIRHVGKVSRGKIRV